MQRIGQGIRVDNVHLQFVLNQHKVGPLKIRHKTQTWIIVQKCVVPVTALSEFLYLTTQLLRLLRYLQQMYLCEILLPSQISIKKGIHYCAEDAQHTKSNEHKYFILLFLKIFFNKFILFHLKKHINFRINTVNSLNVMT